MLLSLQVFWLKDGQQIDVKGDINFIISSEGSLIINQARLLDTGNYTCGAQNIVTRRLSHTVTLTVFGMYNVVMKSDTMAFSVTFWDYQSSPLTGSPQLKHWTAFF